MDYYINADTGNDTTGAGTAVSPWATLAKAYASSAVGDTIHFQSSTAHYALVTATMASRTLIGVSAKTCVLDGGGASAVQWLLSGTFSVSNLRFTNVAPYTAQKPLLRTNTVRWVCVYLHELHLRLHWRV